MNTAMLISAKQTEITTTKRRLKRRSCCAFWSCLTCTPLILLSIMVIYGVVRYNQAWADLYPNVTRVEKEKEECDRLRQSIADAAVKPLTTGQRPKPIRSLRELRTSIVEAETLPTLEEAIPMYTFILERCDKADMEYERTPTLRAAAMQAAISSFPEIIPHSVRSGIGELTDQLARNVLMVGLVAALVLVAALKYCISPLLETKRISAEINKYSHQKSILEATHQYLQQSTTTVSTVPAVMQSKKKQEDVDDEEESGGNEYGMARTLEGTTSVSTKPTTSPMRINHHHHHQQQSKRMFDARMEQILAESPFTNGKFD